MILISILKLYQSTLINFIVIVEKVLSKKIIPPLLLYLFSSINKNHKGIK